MANSFINRRFRYSYSNVTLTLIIINAVVYFLTMSSFAPNIRIGGYPLVYVFSLVPELVIEKGWVWQIFTYMFMHADLSHVFSNMLMLFFFGIKLERALGSKEFLLYYLLTGTLSGLFSFLTYLLSGTNVVLLGASGALFAVMLLYAVAFPHDRILVFWFIPVRVPVFVLFTTILEAFYQVYGFNGGTAHLCHLYGFLFGWLYIVIRMKINPIQRWRQAFRGY